MAPHKSKIDMEQLREATRKVVCLQTSAQINPQRNKKYEHKELARGQRPQPQKIF